MGSLLSLAWLAAWHGAVARNGYVKLASRIVRMANVLIQPRYLLRENFMSYYKHHVFICTNQRQDGRACCEDHKASELRAYLKARVKEEGLAGPQGVRVNNAGCLDRCALGPVMVVYPNETWYRFTSKKDLEEILDSHLRNDKKVQHLRISPKYDD